MGRRRELESILAALGAGRHLLLEGPPGTGKSTVLRAIAAGTESGFEFVEGNAELTPGRLIGSFDPATVLAEGYTPEAFIDGPLLSALKDGSLLYIEEINRVPEETLNVLITVMSEGELHVPRLGHVKASDGFRLVAAMNPFDAIGTARIASAVYDRCCRLAMDYQGEAEETAIVELATAQEPSRAVEGAQPEEGEPPSVPTGQVARTVKMVRDSRTHPDVRTGSSVRGAIDHVLLCAQLAELRGVGVDEAGVTLDAAQLALSGRLRLREGTPRSAEEIVAELWERAFNNTPDSEESDSGEESGNADSGDGNSPKV